MKRVSRRGSSLTWTFALLSLAIIALITGAQITIQWALLRENLLDWERQSAQFIRAEAYSMLRAEDFARWRDRETAERFERFFRAALVNPEILRVKLYDTDMRVVWSDELRLLGARFPGNARLVRALRGETVAHIEHVKREENLYERGFTRTVELYVPLAFSTGRTPGTAAIAGVVEVYKDPTNMLTHMSRDWLIILTTSLAGALVLYAALFGIVRRASRQLQTQRADLERQATALGEANRELRATQGQLRASERLAAIGEVSAAVAHGIRNPLANIRAAAQVGLDTPDDPGSVKRYLSAITAEVDRLGRWLRALLDVVRPFEPRLAPVDPNAMIEDLLALLSERSAQSQIRVERHLASDLPGLMADEVQLQQALLNVLDNALDALPPGGTLEVRTARAGDPEGSEVRVMIHDNGEGIPRDRLGRIFEPFFTTKSQGTGIGLAITRKVIEGHGGRVDIESAPGKGTTIDIRLPVKAPTTA